MLYKETVSANTLELLKELMKDENFHAFFLVGGTALSLQIGHRISIDLDLFSQSSFDENKLLIYLEAQKNFKAGFLDRNTLKGQIDNVQVDFITHAYPLVNDLLVDEQIRCASLEDIAAMKLNAIIGNGTRLKDFVDIAFLSSHLSLAQMVNAYEKKYKSRNAVIVLKAISYHNDINFNEPLLLARGTFKWENIEGRLNAMIKHPDKIFQAI